MVHHHVERLPVPAGIDRQAVAGVARRAGQVAVVRVNVETLPELAREFRVQGVPTFVVVHKGAERGRTIGAADESSFALWAASLT